jgi:hypothetical protein
LLAHLRTSWLLLVVLEVADSEVVVLVVIAQQPLLKFLLVLRTR